MFASFWCSFCLFVVNSFLHSLTSSDTPSFFTYRPNELLRQMISCIAAGSSSNLFDVRRNFYPQYPPRCSEALQWQLLSCLGYQKQSTSYVNVALYGIRNGLLFHILLKWSWVCWKEMNLQKVIGEGQCIHHMRRECMGCGHHYRGSQGTLLFLRKSWTVMQSTSVIHAVKRLLVIQTFGFKHYKTPRQSFLTFLNALGFSHKEGQHICTSARLDGPSWVWHCFHLVMQVLFASFFFFYVAVIENLWHILSYVCKNIDIPQLHDGWTW